MMIPRISIITAVHNQLAVNQLFLQSLQKNTRSSYELIIVDNHSTDGSADFFEKAGATVIRNAENHCYPDSQNMGMAKATGDYFAFLNNDIYLAPDWDINTIEAMESNRLDIVSLGSFEVLEDPIRRRKFFQRWKWLRRGRRHIGMDTNDLRKLADRLYGRKGFEYWAEQEGEHQKPHIFPSINGSAVVTTRNVWNIIGPWDVQVESSDWDLHITAAKRAAEVGDIQVPYIIPWALHHHFARLTFHSHPEPRACNHEHIKLQEKWTTEDIERYGPKLPIDTSWRADLRRWVKKFRIDFRRIDREKVNQKR
jgi:glycosyltransferase involved in cell wall biosynthesis